MKKDDVVILVVTFLTGIMVLVFVIMLVFIGNNMDKLVSGNVKFSETSFIEEEKNEARIYW